MPTKGQVLVNPLSGDQFEFLETALDTAGERVTIKATGRSKGRQVPNHIHVLQDETFEIISGELTVWTDGESRTYQGGREGDPSPK